jgi:pSer/pThr/pTyr-binding forkhead associated (FHA) protein
MMIGGCKVSEETKAFLRVEKLAKGKIEGYEEWDESPLSTDAVLMARPDKKADAVSPDIKIVGDDYISRNQAEIYYSFGDGCFMLRDTGSLNGTFLNGELLEKNQAYPLADQDLIGLSKIAGEIRVVFRFRLSEATLPAWVVEESAKASHKEGLAINLAARRVFITGKEIPLTKREFKVLEVLYNDRGKACSIDDISWEVWGEEGASDELIAKYISRLRDKIETDPAKPSYIITVPGRHGCYRLDL